jgi:hypothetical protein
VDWLQRARDEAEAALKLAPDDLANMLAAGRAGVNLAALLVQLERRAEAAEPAALARERLQRAAALGGAALALDHDLAWAAVQEGYGRLARAEPERALALAESLEEAAQHDARLAVASGELLAGCAAATHEPGERQHLRARALDRLELGLQLGFSAIEYLAHASEWADLRDDPRFAALLAGRRD